MPTNLETQIMLSKVRYFLALPLMILFISNSCKKKCETSKEDVNSGLIVEDVIIYPTSGYIPNNYGGGPLYFANTAGTYINDSLVFANFQVSFDGGHSREYLDYNQYDILAIPMTVNCQTSFVRDVSVGPGSTIIYRVEATSCSSCEQIYGVENWVIIPSLPAGTTVIFQQDTKLI